MKKLKLFFFLTFCFTPLLLADLTVSTFSDSSPEAAVKRDPIAEESLVRQDAPTLEEVETSPLEKEFNALKLNDGTLDSAGTSNFRSLWVVFRLTTKTAPNGYDISEIRVYSGSKELNATIFQNYDVYYHVVGAPQDAWDLLIEGVKLGNSEVGVSEAKFFSRGQQTTIADSSGKSIMQNVDAIKIDFRKRVLAYPDYSRFAEITDESGAASTNFQEIVVLGKASDHKGAKAAAASVNLFVSTDRKDAIFQEGEPVQFNISLDSGINNSSDETTVEWKITKDGASLVDSGSLKLKEGIATVTGRLSEPGFLLCEASYIHPLKGKITALGAAAINPLQIKPSLPPPEDFDAFWAKKKAELATIPINARLTPVNLSENESKKVKLFDLQADSVGAPVSGYFALPAYAKPSSCPAVLKVHGAGVYSSGRESAISWASRGLLALDMNAHGIPNGKPVEFYEELAKNGLRGYHTRGAESRDSIYFLGMYLRLIRAIDFLTSQPEWDGRTLLVVGGSQGGAQAIAAAGLDDRVSFISADVPAMCDHTGVLADRQRGWPKFLPGTKSEAEKQKNIIEAVRYYDCVNFASRIKVKSVFSAGFIDTVCAPTTVYAAYNNLSGEKQIFNDIAGDHRGTALRAQASDQAVNDYLAAASQNHTGN